MKDETVKALFGIGCVTTIVIACLYKGIDSTLLALGVAAISGLAGYELRKRKEKEGE